MHKIIWLASYPKSGNTWFRIFMSHLLHEQEEEITINKLKTDGIFSSRFLLDKVIGIESSDLTAEEIDRLRPKAYNYLSQNLEKNLFVKVHDAYTYLAEGTPLLGTVNAKAIYIIRNPLDVAVSFANHLSQSLDNTIEIMGNKEYAFCKGTNSLPNQLRQQLLTWSQHAESWKHVDEMKIHFMRYEDMKLNPLSTFMDAVKFIGLDYSEEQIKQAIDQSDFNKVKEEENKIGFREKPSKTKSFFRKGTVGDWRNHLNEEQVEKLINDHYETMKKFGYLDDEGNIVF